MKTWAEAKRDLESNTLFLVHQPGPTVYQIKDEEEKSCRVILGDTHICSCIENGFCMHILFVLLKVLRIPQKNPLVQKRGFTDAEIDIALAGNFEERVRPKHQSLLRKKVNTASKESEGDNSSVARQILSGDEEEICPICQDDMKNEHALTWCRKGCGNNIHAKCMKMYAQYKATTKKDILCPLCRVNWGPMAMHIINEDCKGNASLKKSCAKVTCSSCSLQIRGIFHRCVDCSINEPNHKCKVELANKGASFVSPVDFCKLCFKNLSRMHAKHCFIMSTTDNTLRDFTWEYVKNPRASARVVSVELMEELQNRELNTDDYAMLLDLDKPQLKDIQDILLDALPIGECDVKCWCEDDAVHVDTKKSRRCGHSFHTVCCGEKLNDAINDGFWKIEELLCPHDDCNLAIFGGIGRRRRKKTNQPHDAKQQICDTSARSNYSPLQQSFMIAGAGLCSSATKLANTGSDEGNEQSQLHQVESNQNSETAPFTVINGPLAVNCKSVNTRATSRALANQSSKKPAMVRGLVLTGNPSIRRHSRVGSSFESSHLFDVPRTGASSLTESRNTNMIEDSSQILRTESAPTVALSRPYVGTSSFAPSTKQRRSAQGDRNCVKDENCSHQLSEVFSITSTSAFKNCERDNKMNSTQLSRLKGTCVSRKKESHVCGINSFKGKLCKPQKLDGSNNAFAMSLNLNH